MLSSLTCWSGSHVHGDALLRTMYVYIDIEVKACSLNCSEFVAPLAYAAFDIYDKDHDDERSL